MTGAKITITINVPEVQEMLDEDVRALEGLLQAQIQVIVDEVLKKQGAPHGTAKVSTNIALTDELNA